MKKILVFIFFTTLIFACGDAGDQKPSGVASTPAPKPAKKIDGSKIYKTYCITCHGLYGDMGGSSAFDLTKSALTLDERIQVITKGRNLMTPFEGLLSEDKIRAVAEYVETLRN